ncbi:MAG: carboxymuconolactone decarboxylase family protein [Acidimicrobiales bacterium]
MSWAKELLDEMRVPSRELRDLIPGVYSGFAAIDHAAMADGALSEKVKQLVALAISVTRECDGCVAAHAKAAARAGATEPEVAEALGVAIQMNGGPGTVWGPRAFAAFREFADTT